MDFRAPPGDARREALLAQTEEVEVVATDSPREALLLENNITDARSRALAGRQDYTRAMDAQAEQLFAPGTGAAPQALTGRGEEQAVLSRCLAALAAGRAPAHDVVLVGPRGNGKTVLLNWFAQACRSSSKRVDALARTPADVEDRQSLADALAPRRALAKLLPRKIAIASVGSAEWAASAGPRSIAGALVARCRRRPLAVLLDEDLRLGG